MKIFEGIIVSVGMNQTSVVEVSRKTPHPKYKKLIKRSKKYKVDTNGLELIIGNKVKIVETRPISKNKFFKVLSIVSAGENKKNVEKVSKGAVLKPTVKTEIKVKTKTEKKGKSK